MTAYIRPIMEYEQVWRYLTELRRLQKDKYSQEQIAAAVGLSRNGWQNIERGKTDDPGASVLLNAIRMLNASFDDVRELANAQATAQDAISRAQQRKEIIDAHGIASKADSRSADEIRASLLEFEREIAQVTLAFPWLSSLLMRLRGE